LPKHIIFDANQIEWIESNLDSMTLSDMAKELDVCVDTFKRKLVKLGLKDFDGAKFVPPRDFNAAYWRRPCMRCKGTDRRPKNQFICSRCKQTDYEYL